MVLYLKSKRQKIPDELVEMKAQLSDINDFADCWQYFKGTADRHNCDQCIVYQKRLKPCFSTKKTAFFDCSTACLDCGYYMKTYLPRIEFIHQISCPAAVLKDYYLWGGNNPWVELCGLRGKDLPGMGIEQMFHADSLEKVIAGIKKMTSRNPLVAKSYNTFFKGDEREKIAVRISIYALNDPAEALLILAEPKDG